MVSLELWLGILAKHVAFLELWLRLTSVTDVSVPVVAFTDGFKKIALIGVNW